MGLQCSKLDADSVAGLGQGAGVALDDRTITTADDVEKAGGDALEVKDVGHGVLLLMSMVNPFGRAWGSV